MNERNLFDQFPNPCQLKNNNWPKWSGAPPQTEPSVQIKCEDGNYNKLYNNLYSYSPSYQEHPSYFDSERKPQINKNVHLSCNIPAGQHQIDPTNYYYGGGANHQVPGNEEPINYDTSSNEFYAEMPKHNLSHQSHVIHSDEMYQGAFPTTSHSQILPIPISEGSTSLPVSLTPYTLSSNGSAPPSPSLGYEHDSSHFIHTSSSGGFQDPMISPYPAGPYSQFSYDEVMQASSRGGKDLKYCERRRKNNEASKKSRAKKKEKAKEMESRAHVLEQENRHLRQKYSELEQEVAVYKQLTEKITNCDSQECNAPTYIALQQLRGDQVRANAQFPE